MEEEAAEEVEPKSEKKKKQQKQVEEEAAGLFLFLSYLRLSCHVGQQADEAEETEAAEEAFLLCVLVLACQEAKPVKKYVATCTGAPLVRLRTKCSAESLEDPTEFQTPPTKRPKSSPQDAEVPAESLGVKPIWCVMFQLRPVSVLRRSGSTRSAPWIHLLLLPSFLLGWPITFCTGETQEFGSPSLPGAANCED